MPNMANSSAATMTDATANLGVSTIGKRKKNFPPKKCCDDNAIMEERVCTALDEFLRDSVFFDENPPRELPQFPNDDIKLGTILGAGEFGAVYQIDSFQKKKGGCGCNTICGDRPSSSITLPKETAPVITQQQSRATSSANSGTDIPPLVLLLEASAIVVPSMSSSKEELDDDNDNNDDDAISDLDENEDMLNEHDGEVDYLREYLIHHVYRCGQYRYAMKRLRKTESLRCDPVDAMIDMAFEARILSSISHPNIVKIRAIMGTPGQPENFGIIMDRLNETLREKIDAWTMSEKKDNRGWSLLQRFVGPGKNTVARQTKSDLLLERFLAVYDIARALKYLHEKNILYRDLKPENVGVNLRGDYILFDFGLAKELKRIDLIQPPDGFEATGMTGSRRYMAPEVVSCKHYGFTADVYSFAILFWETMSLQIPYPKMTLDQHFEHVVVKGKRPNTKVLLKNNIVPKPMERMMEDCWSEDPLKRPSFKSICDRLYEEISNREGTVAGNGMEERTKYLLDKSNVSRTDSIKECC